jgi:BASS family bile acid:Na+ symporter
MKALLMSTVLLQVVAVGVHVAPRDMWPVIRRPIWVLRVALAMFVAVPLLALILVSTFDMPVVMRGALVLLATSAAAPLLPGKLGKFGIDPAYDAALAAVTSLLAIVLVPLLFQILGAVFQREGGITALAVARVLMTTFLLPLAIGMMMRAALGPTGVRLGEMAGSVGFILLGVLVLLLIVAKAGSIFPLLWQSAMAILLFAAGALLIGHLLGGPDPRERTSLAIATLTRHPGLALLIATRTLPQVQDMPSAVVAVILGTAITTIPYTIWRRRVHAVGTSPHVGAPADAR